MKFILEQLTKCAPRCGTLRSIQRMPNMSLETPFALLYTKGGSVPHLTREVLQFLTQDVHGLQIPLVSTANFFQPMSEFDGTIADFIGLKEYFTYVTVQDPADITPNGHHLQNNIPIWTRSGKLYFNSESYMNTIEAFKPDMYCVLSDGDTNKTSSKKRIAKSVDQTLSLFSQCLERHHSSTNLKHSILVAAIEGGYCLQSREKCISSLLKHSDDIGGFLIEGLHNNGPEVEFLDFTEITEVVQKVIAQLPSDKFRIIHGCWNPLVTIKLVSLGIDIFDTSYIHVVTERKAALTFNYDPITNEHPQRKYEINFRNAKYAEDIQPIVEGCECLACTKYTRAYIQHLFVVQELLGPILLNIHNIHHYLEFFKRIRKAVKNGTLNELEQLIQIQFDEYQRVLTEKKEVVAAL